jgi:hypothetical protein
MWPGPFCNWFSIIGIQGVKMDLHMDSSSIMNINQIQDVLAEYIYWPMLDD